MVSAVIRPPATEINKAYFNSTFFSYPRTSKIILRHNDRYWVGNKRKLKSIKVFLARRISSERHSMIAKVLYQHKTGVQRKTVIVLWGFVLFFSFSFQGQETLILLMKKQRNKKIDTHRFQVPMGIQFRRNQ